MVGSQLELLVSQIMGGLLKPQAAPLLPGLRPQLGALLGALMQQDSKVWGGGVRGATWGGVMQRGVGVCSATIPAAGEQQGGAWMLAAACCGTAHVFACGVCCAQLLYTYVCSLTHTHTHTQ